MGAVPLVYSQLYPGCSLYQYQPTRYTFAHLKPGFGTPRAGVGLCSGYRSTELPGGRTWRPNANGRFGVHVDCSVGLDLARTHRRLTRVCERYDRLAADIGRTAERGMNRGHGLEL
jgi:hypothetical protein